MNSHPSRLISSQENYAHLSGIFSPSALNDLLSKAAGASTTRIIRQSRLLTEYYERQVELKILFRSAYSILKNNYRSEYVYKNSLVQQLLMEKHILKNAVFIPEFNVGVSKADIAVFNGTSTAYEIKSELDNTGKLNKQLNSYLSVFDKVYLLTHETLASRVQHYIDPRVGIIVLDRNCGFSTIRSAISNKAYTDPSAVFNCLRRSEYLWILKELLNYTPLVKPEQLVTACQSLFSELPPRTAHDYMVSAIVSNRRLRKTQIELVNTSPEELKMYALSKFFTDNQCNFISISLSKTTIV